MDVDGDTNQERITLAEAITRNNPEEDEKILSFIRAVLGENAIYALAIQYDGRKLWIRRAEWNMPSFSDTHHLTPAEKTLGPWTPYVHIPAVVINLPGAVITFSHADEETLYLLKPAKKVQKMIRDANVKTGVGQ